MAAKAKQETAAGRVIRAFGGARRLAAHLGIKPEAVYRWDYPKKKNGSAGTIPSVWHRPIMKKAGELGIDIKPADLVNL